MYQRQGHGWISHPPLLHRGNHTGYFLCKTFKKFRSTSLPPDLVRATITVLPLSVVAIPAIKRAQTRFPFEIQWDKSGSPPSPTHMPEKSLPLLARWELLQSQCTPHYGWVPDSIRLEGLEEDLLNALSTDQLIVISDGSYKDGIGTAATQITTKTRLHHLAQVPGYRPPG